MMNALIEGIQKNKFAVLGRAGMDMFADPIGVKSEKASTFKADLGGSSANICVGLSKLGSYSALITSVSDDAVGRFCVNRLKYYGVDTQFIKYISGEYRTSLAIYESCMNNFQNVIYRNNAADFQVTNKDISRINYGDFGALLATGTVLACEPSRSATFLAFEKAKEAGLPIIFDIDYRPYSWSSPEIASDVLTQAGKQSDLLIGNDEEFDFMAGGIKKGLNVAERLAKNSERIVIYKMGSEGAITFASGKEIHTGIFPAAPVKPNGAGDSFMAGLLSSISEGRDLTEAIYRGSACAAIVVSKPGCAPAMPTHDQLDAFMKKHPHPKRV